MDQKQNSFWVFFIILIGTIVWCSFSLIEIQKAKVWPIVKGRIIYSKVSHSAHGRGRGRTVYEAKIQFSYVVDGKAYVSDKSTLGEYDSSKPEDAQRIVDKFPINKEVTVYYKPEDPQDAIIDFDKSSVIYIFALGVICAFIAAGILKGL